MTAGITVANPSKTQCLVIYNYIKYWDCCSFELRYKQLKFDTLIHAKSSEKASENLSQNNSAISIHINSENIFYILEII